MTGQPRTAVAPSDTERQTTGEEEQAFLDATDEAITRNAATFEVLKTLVRK